MKYLICFLLSLLLLSPLLFVSEPLPSQIAVFQNLALKHQKNVLAKQAQAKITSLTNFFNHYHCPDINYQLIPDYIAAATISKTDYRLLPAISLAESTCLERYPIDTNNPFGYGSSTGLYRFESLQAAISYIDGQLATADPYAGKTALEIFKSYGPHNNPSYAPRVFQIMLQIGAETTKP